MTDNHTMAELLRAPTEGYAEAIVVPPILAEQFELEHSLINMMTTNQFFGLKKDNPHDHIRAARRWLEKEPPRSITTWEDLVSKFINEFFPPSRTTNLHNEILNFQQWFDESFHEAWDRYKDLLRACPHHDFTELHQLDTFYNALNPADQDSLNAAAGGNWLERSTQDVLTIIENKSKQTSAVTTAMTAMLKQFQATPPPAPLKDVEEVCVTCAAVNYNQGNSGYRPQGIANQIRPPGFAQPNVQNNQNRFGPPQGFNRGNNFNHEQSYQATTQQNQNFHLSELEKIKRMNEANMKAMQTQIDMVKNELRNEMKSSIQTSLSNQTNEIKNMMASLLQMNTASGWGSLPSNTVANPKGELKAITTRSGLVTDGPTVPTPPKSITPEVDERVVETFTDPDLAMYTIKVPPPPLKCKALDDLGASINLMPLSVWKKLGLPELIPTRMTLELANRAICTPARIAKDVFFLVGKFTFPADFIIVDYKSDPRVPLILRRPFLRTARALIDVHGEEMILCDGDKRLTLNMRHDTFSYSNQPQKESVNLINVFNNSSEDFLEDLFSNQPSGNPTFSPHPELTSPKVNNDIFYSEGGNVLSEKSLDLDSTKDLHPPFHNNPLSGSTTYFSNSLLEEFTDELALITLPPEYDDNLQFDIEFDLKEIEFLLYQDKYYNLKNLIDQKDPANLADIFVDPIPEMFINEHAPDYSSPLIFDVYDDDFLEVESDAGNVYDGPFDSKGEKIKESKLLIDELDPPCDFLPPFEYDSFISQDFSRVDALLSTNNEDKVFNPGILIQEKPIKTITRVVQDKKLAISTASLVL
nr:reverse transcriptase domain-containing protein [Tanacetum cinerariifolium]